MRKQLGINLRDPGVPAGERRGLEFVLRGSAAAGVQQEITSILPRFSP
jgi:hypothetical protein